MGEDLPRSQKADAKHKGEELLSSLPTEIKKRSQISEHPSDQDLFLIKPEVSMDDHKTTAGELIMIFKMDRILIHSIKSDDDVSITEKKKGIL